MKPTSGAKPNTSIVVKGARQRQISIAEEFKIQGNSYFSSLDYSKAIECYTRSLNALAKDQAKIANPTEMRKLTLSNRAQAYLKLRAYGKAYDDSNQACMLDPAHVKSLGRRGTAAYYLGKIKEAMRDFVEIITLEPKNVQFLEYLKKCEERLQKIRDEAYEKM